MALESWFVFLPASPILHQTSTPWRWASRPPRVLCPWLSLQEPCDASRQGRTERKTGLAHSCLTSTRAGGRTTPQPAQVTVGPETPPPAQTVGREALARRSRGLEKRAQLTCSRDSCRKHPRAHILRAGLFIPGSACHALWGPHASAVRRSSDHPVQPASRPSPGPRCLLAAATQQ